MTQKFKDAYRALPVNETTVLQILSIAYEPISTTDFIKILGTYKRSCDTKCKLTQIGSKGILSRLNDAQLAYFHDGYMCSRKLIGDVTLDAIKDGNYETMLQSIQRCLPTSDYDNLLGIDIHPLRYIREIRASAYNNDHIGFKRNLRIAYRAVPQIAHWPIYDMVFNAPFNTEWFKTLPKALQYDALFGIGLHAYFHLSPITDIQAIIKDYHPHAGKQHLGLYSSLLSAMYILQGRLGDAESLVWSRYDPAVTAAHKASLDFIAGRNDEAIKKFNSAFNMSKKSDGKRKASSPHLHSLFYTLALIKSNDASHHARIANMIKDATKRESTQPQLCYHYLQAVFLANNGQFAPAEDILARLWNIDGLFLDTLFCCLTAFWFFPEYLLPYRKKLQAIFNNAVDNGYDLAAMELAFISARLWPDNKECADFVSKTQERIGIQCIAASMKKREPWEHSVNALLKLNPANSQKRSSQMANARLVWLVDFNRYSLTPREQTARANGTWSKGRRVALKRIMNCEVACMSPQDHEIAKTIERSVNYASYYRYYSETNYNFDMDRALSALAGHPLIFLEDSPQISVELSKGAPELIVKKDDQGIWIQFATEFNGAETTIIQETPTRFTIIRATETQAKILNILGSDGLLIPPAAEKNAVDIIETLSSIVTIHSDIGHSAIGIPTVDANPQIHVHLLPVGEGLRLELFIKPFGQIGPCFNPAAGGKNVFAEIDGKRVQTVRELQKEEENAHNVISACPSLAGIASPDDALTFMEPDECLQVLIELQELGSQVVIDWPEGGKLSVSKPVTFDNLQLVIRKKTDWFEMTGELQVNEDIKLNIQKVIELVDKSPGNFVPIDNGSFVAMTSEFRRRIAELAAFSEKSKDGCRFHPLTSLAVQDFVDNVNGLDADKDWDAQVKRLTAALEFRPELPSTLQAELRSYQIDGFNWLARLAKWGVGACLADDMGLGKTVQTIAIILDRATKGPSLVVAPSSVCFNWQHETNRFAPTLRVQLFGGKNREETLKGLKPFDILICSYGLLQTEQQKFSEIKWATIVLDEAQAIKNFSAKRSKSAMALQGDFKIITTGTPIENHLGELWNLFRFINPGLLGSLDRFNRVFATPIEKNDDIGVKNRLKRLIQPFILRRLKNQVLDELPPKTEITLSVELSVEEASFYDALRQQALKKLDSLESEEGGQKHLKILTEIMKLRRACCHSSLALPEINIKSSKLARFTEVVEELRENHHKILVFSQFVGHLSIIKKQVEKMGIPYQYLDGSTPVKERKRRVEAFQSGKGDLFLISLKAGGLGLNLTAADYVIHMDPWWNPAVEDQASDRAHRIGQKRPVTIYRLITSNTIEEKIVSLHSRKRDLADNLLEGTESAGKITAEQLMALIKNE